MTILGKIAYTAVVAFVASIATLVAVGLLAPAEKAPGTATVPSVPTAAAGSGATATRAAGAAATVPAPSATASGGGSGITLAEIAQHAGAASCWMAIDGLVYDITAYIARHPTSPEVLYPWCGKEATPAWDTKGGTGKSTARGRRRCLPATRSGPWALAGKTAAPPVAVTGVRTASVTRVAD